MSKKKRIYLTRKDLCNNELYRIKYEHKALLRTRDNKLHLFDNVFLQWNSVENDAFYNRMGEKCYYPYKVQ